jgi:hypothetical protein
MRDPGFGTRFDRFTPNQISDTRARTSGDGLFLPYQTRFCEGCRKNVPFKRRPGQRSTACKGWKCSTCRRKQA